MIFIYYTRTMQKVRIPQMVDPVRSAAKRLTYKGIIPKEKLLRLSDIVKILTDLDVELSFSVDLQGMTVIEGNVGTSVKCECQRCGELFNFDIETDLVYSSDEEKAKKKDIADLIAPYSYNTKGYHILFIAKNQIGWTNLMKLSGEASDKCTYNGRPHCDLNMIKKHSEGLICTTACLAAS